MKVFVTGGAGYIGSITCHLLLREGHEIIVYDDLSTGHATAIPKNVDFIAGDILDSKKLNMSMQDCDAILHFAGRAIVSESYEKENEYNEINFAGSKNVFTAATKNCIQKIVVSSSCAVYGDRYLTPISEEFEERPINPYGLSKLRMDRALSELIANEVAVGAISLRFFNVAGALNLGDKWIGENHAIETHVIPNLIKSNEDNPFKLYGNNYSTPDGTCIRDYIHVVDIAHAHILALGKIIFGKHEVFNLGTNIGHSLEDLIQLVGLIRGYKIPVELRKRRPGDPDQLVAENSKAQSLLGWKPILSLRQMIEDDLEFRKSNLPAN